MPVIDPKKLPLISPTGAAKELRQGIRHALLHWNDNKWHSAPLKKSVQVHHDYSKAHGAKVDQSIQALEAALVARRTKEARVHLSTLASQLRMERENVNNMMKYVNTLPAEIWGHSGLDRKMLERWNDLVQSLPTVEEIPQGREQNVVRAIIAILRANKMGDLGAMTQVVEDQEGATNGASEEAAG